MSRDRHRRARGPLLRGRSASTANPTYWWYRSRDRLLLAVFAPYLARQGRPLVIDIGSADGASVGWVDGLGCRRVGVDSDVGALAIGDVAGSIVHLPLASATIESALALDVVEHVAEEAGLGELRRILRIGGLLFVSVPAYQWLWTSFDEDSGHRRRYTRRRIIGALERNGFSVERATYGFALTFPLFVASRLIGRVSTAHLEAPQSSRVGRADPFLAALCRLEERLLRHIDLPFGSSIFVVAQRV